MRRPRGCGGRFLNTKKDENAQNLNVSINPNNSKQPAHPATSPSSEILQSDSGNPNSASCGWSISRSEVTSMYSRGDNDRFDVIEHLRPSLYHPISNMIVGDRSSVIPLKWGVAADGCCDLLKVWGRACWSQMEEHAALCGLFWLRDGPCHHLAFVKAVILGFSLHWGMFLISSIDEKPHCSV